MHRLARIQQAKIKKFGHAKPFSRLTGKGTWTRQDVLRHFLYLLCVMRCKTTKPELATQDKG
jgi:hypothetical protein